MNDELAELKLEVAGLKKLAALHQGNFEIMNERMETLRRTLESCTRAILAMAVPAAMPGESGQTN